MTSMTKRVLTTAITLPALFSLIYFLPHHSHLALSLLAVLTTLAAASEIYALLSKVSITLPNTTVYLVALMPIAQWVQIQYTVPVALVELVLILLALIFFAKEIAWGKRDGFQHSLARIGGMSLIIIYPGLLITYIQRLTSVAYPSEALLLFFILIFGNDVFAFIFGMWLGKNNRGHVAVSPNKSIAGFIGGSLSAIVLSIVCTQFILTMGGSIQVWQAALLGLATSIAANIGDLIESAFKRSADVKDSGFIIPGRGGLLDSIDSMLVGAPIFWLFLTIL
jgi:phosphatidate cytidylyltransferase